MNTLVQALKAAGFPVLNADEQLQMIDVVPDFRSPAYTEAEVEQIRQIAADHGFSQTIATRRGRWISISK